MFQMSEDVPKHYRGLVLGLCALFRDRYKVTSNRGSGEGRFDIQLNPKNPDHPGFLFALKSEKNAGQVRLKALANEALDQICVKEYTEQMRSQGVRSITQYGVAFSRKRVEVSMVEA